MPIPLESVKLIYLHAIDARASDGEGEAWWSEVADEVRGVLAARTLSDAAALIEWWHHYWPMVDDTPRCAAKRIREAGRALCVKK